jgi:hypothetical protein
MQIGLPSLLVQALAIESTESLELEFVLRPTVSRPTSSPWYRAPLWDPWSDLHFSFFSFDNYFVVLPKAPSLTRGRVCSLQCNRCWSGQWRPITTLYRLIWDYFLFVATCGSQGLWWKYSNPPPHGYAESLALRMPVPYTLPASRARMEIGTAMLRADYGRSLED